jgi:hypothetical protein
VEKFPQAAAGKSVAACGVFAVDDNELGIVFSPEIGDQLFYSFPAALADDISYKYKSHYITSFIKKEPREDNGRRNLP